MAAKRAASSSAWPAELSMARAKATDKTIFIFAPHFLANRAFITARPQSLALRRLDRFVEWPFPAAISHQGRAFQLFGDLTDLDLGRNELAQFSLFRESPGAPRRAWTCLQKIPVKKVIQSQGGRCRKVVMLRDGSGIRHRGARRYFSVVHAS
jgi:hypothetical protein